MGKRFFRIGINFNDSSWLFREEVVLNEKGFFGRVLKLWWFMKEVRIIFGEYILRFLVG